MNISHSRVELYSTCAYKYYLSYVEKWSPDKTFTPLLFGSAIDEALNDLLTSKMEGRTPDAQKAKDIFNTKMEEWGAKNELSYFKNEAPATDPVTGTDFDELGDLEKQWAVWHNLVNIGWSMIDKYVTEILPLFTRIISVQTKRYVPNEAGDNLVLITDFKAELADGRIVLFDNKTSSDIKKYYGPSSVKKSQQLAIYTEYEETRLAGYIALQKKLVKGEIAWKMVVDEIEEEQVEAAFQKVDVSLRGITAGEFPKNDKACFSFGRKCDMWDLCKYGNAKGLIKRD